MINKHLSEKKKGGTGVLKPLIIESLQSQLCAYFVLKLKMVSNEPLAIDYFKLQVKFVRFHMNV